MWLINCTTFKLEDIIDISRTPYAILSHTWEDEEVSFQEFQDLENTRRKNGLAKISMTCKLAKQRGLNYCWVDTCCIDKKSSAELTEAINSMFQWYKKAAVCFVFLTDLPQSNDQGSVPEGVPLEQLRPCRWFTRGWTLQELIAPLEVVFFDKIWQRRGDKSSLLSELSEITGVGEAILSHRKPIAEVCLAQRMSWAATRKTTRVEDIAYCLLGIFDVYMPMLYGEGKHAFSRLQEEIVKSNDDLSIFAWKANNRSQKYRGIFAYSPDEYQHCRSMLWRRTIHGAHLTLTNKGVLFDHSWLLDKSPGYLFKLDCWHISSDECVSFDGDISSDDGAHGILLIKTPGNVFVRVDPHSLVPDPIPMPWNIHYQNYVHAKNYYIPRYLAPAMLTAIERQYQGALILRWDDLLDPISILSVKPSGCWDPVNKLFFVPYNLWAGFVRIVLRGPGSGEHRECLLLCGMWLELPALPVSAKNIKPIKDNRLWCCLWSEGSPQWAHLEQLEHASTITELDILRILGGWPVDKEFAEYTCNQAGIRASISNSTFEEQEVFQIDLSTYDASGEP